MELYQLHWFDQLHDKYVFWGLLFLQPEFEFQLANCTRLLPESEYEFDKSQHAGKIQLLQIFEWPVLGIKIVYHL